MCQTLTVPKGGEAKSLEGGGGGVWKKEKEFWKKRSSSRRKKEGGLEVMGGRTEDPALAWQTARGQRRLPVVQVVRADVVPQVRGTVGHAESRGAEEAGAEGACVGGREVSRLGGEGGGGGGEEVLLFVALFTLS